ncbi:M23 family metallopeptidase [Lacinutrix undariae]
MRKLILLLLCLQFASAKAQYPQDYFRSPLEIPLVLSGTFAELRSNHFHSGLDIKTQQKQGLKVIAAAQGYVSRIKISHYGYGKAIYVTHPNGYTTVYAHLQKFSPAIESYIKECQYQKETYEVEVFPTPNELPIVNDELIAFSGNSGGSGGPHLHFEIRDNEERPINPMLFGMDIKDSKRPTVLGIYAYTKNDSSSVNNKSDRVHLRLIPNKNGDYAVEKIKAYGTIGFGVISHDQQDMAYNKNGVNNIQTFFNGHKNFEMDFKRFSFDESKHINRFIDFEYFKDKRSRIQKLFVEKGNTLSMLKDVNDNGYITISDSVSSVYKIRINDFKGNDSWITIPITGEKTEAKSKTNSIKPMHFAYADQSTVLAEGMVSVYFPANTFYDDTNLNFKVSSDTLLLHKDVIPLQKKFNISYDISAYKSEHKDKLFIAQLYGYYKRPYYISTTRKGDILTARTKSLGLFTLTADLEPPKIEPLNFSDRKWVSKLKTLQVKITDDLSGISNYRATVNGKWILMEYDYKTKTLTHHFSDNVVIDTENNLKIIVTDNVGNNATFEATFFRK